MQSVVLKYDGSFEGLLSAIFQIYEEKLWVEDIIPEGRDQKSLFSESLEIVTNSKKAKRLATGIKSRSAGAFRKIRWAFLSEKENIELSIYRMIQYMFSSDKNAGTDYSHPDVLLVSKTAKQVAREKHRMEAFVRFRLTKDHIYFSLIEPDFNVLPLIASHFKSRYADQNWMIYDLKRRYAIFYDLNSVSYVTIDLPQQLSISGASEKFFDETEIQFQELWKNYFDSTNIKSRVNTKLHVQHVPKRYWKYLSEKSPFA